MAIPVVLLIASLALAAFADSCNQGSCSEDVNLLQIHSKGDCTTSGQDPWASGTKIACCQGLQKCMDQWDNDGNWYYKCLSQCSQTTTTSSTATVDPSHCTVTGEDPYAYASGSKIGCCQGLQECLGEWNQASQQWGYKCASKCSMGTYYPHFDTSPDYLNISARAKGLGGNGGNLSDNFYLVVGDSGGCAGGCGDCCKMQYDVANLMKKYVADRKEANPNSELLFVLMVGDNFYWTGASEGRFQATWKDVYGDLTDVPWFAIMGNHDIGSSDPEALCPFFGPRVTCNETNSHLSMCGGPMPYSNGTQMYASNQLNADKGGVDPDVRGNYNMPDFMYYYTIPELDFELLGLDTNWFDADGAGGNGFGPNAGATATGDFCGGVETAKASLEAMKDASFAILKDRAQAAASKNVAIISHYPDDFQESINLRKDYLDDMPEKKRSSARVFNFYGHTHTQNCEGYDDSGCVDFLTGGSGGCCAMSDVPAGFVAINWGEDGFQNVECFHPDGRCTFWSYYDYSWWQDPAAPTPSTPAPRATSKTSLQIDVCNHTNDHPQCPNYVGYRR
mmetsp:Transcript_32324/g.58681  ORF Transcript_32324/g.58681 Transcript_32324/m.58681 type:complete len:563 (-) Transcript_32324:124-1812(-)